MLQIADCDFLIEVLRVPNSSIVRGLKRSADAKLAAELQTLGGDKGSVAARELAMKVIAIKPPEGEELLSLPIAAQILSDEIRTLDKDKPGGPRNGHHNRSGNGLGQRPNPLHTARNEAGGGSE